MRKIPKNENRHGFTLIEAVVVIAIMAALAGISMVYNRSSEQQLVLIRDQNIVSTILRRAKSYSIEKYNPAPIAEGTVTCGFGVHFNAASKNFILFQDTATGACKDPITKAYLGNGEYDDPDEKLETYAIDSRISFQLGYRDSFNTPITIPSGTPLDILFVPPDPTASTTAAAFPVFVELKTQTGHIASVVVGSEGQISSY